MPRGTARKTTTNWWTIVDGNEQPLVKFDHSEFNFVENGALVDFEDPDNDGTANSVISAFDRLEMRSASRGAFMSGSLAGALRVTPLQVNRAADDRFAAREQDGKAKSATPGYVTAVALLFPVEAATLFPIGKSIAGNDGGILSVVILATVLFVVALRYFATQDPNTGKPAWNEIFSAAISLLLWIGATKGYWVASKGAIFNWGSGAEKGAAIFGFITIMWVALAPYLVKESAKTSLEDS